MNGTTRAPREDPGKNAEQFISGLADQAVEALTNTDISKQDRAKRFRVMLTDNFAIKTIARWVLGRHWKKASDAEKTEYLHLFEELLVVTYVDRFSSYSGESLKIVKSLVNNRVMHCVACTSPWYPIKVSNGTVHDVSI